MAQSKSKQKRTRMKLQQKHKAYQKRHKYTGEKTAEKPKIAKKETKVKSDQSKKTAK